MTDAQLQAIKDRLEGTLASWYSVSDLRSQGWQFKDADFAANAPQDIADLLAEVSRLSALLETRQKVASEVMQADDDLTLPPEIARIQYWDPEVGELRCETQDGRIVWGVGSTYKQAVQSLRESNVHLRQTRQAFRREGTGD